MHGFVFHSASPSCRHLDVGSMTSPGGTLQNPSITCEKYVKHLVDGLHEIHTEVLYRTGLMLAVTLDQDCDRVSC